MEHGEFHAKKATAFDVINIVFLSILALITFFPLYNVMVLSISSASEYITNPFMLWPSTVDTGSYEYIFYSTGIPHGFLTSGVVTVLGMLYSMVLTVFMAYGLSKKKLVFRGLFMNLIVFTMYFSGGLIPYYLQVTSLGLNNSIFSMIVPAGVNTFYLIVMKNYFLTLPDELEESARLDGANEFTILFRIILPLSMPVIMTYTLFYSVDRWNEWWNAMLFISDDRLFPLQLILRNIIVFLGNGDLHNMRNVLKPPFGIAVKSAAIILTILPILFVYPFIQRYFTKGILIGAIKS